MKKISFIALCFMVLFGSCKKNESPNNYYVRFNANGVNKNYTGYVLAHNDVAGGFTTLTILGSTSSSSFGDYMGIYLSNYPSNTNIIAGQYQDLTPGFTLLTTYENGGHVYESGESVAQDAITYSIPIAEHFKVTITSMDNTTVKGIFSGDYFEDGDVHNTPIHITNGEFYVNFQ